MKTALPFTFLALLLSSSCVLYKPDAARPADRSVLPEGYAQSGKGEAEAGLHPWWAEFGDAQLNALMEEAAAGNLSLQEAWARLEQSRATARQSGAALRPTLDVTGAAGTTRWGEALSSATGSKRSEDYALGLAGSYELDLWGRIRSQREMAQLQAEAGAEDLRTLWMGLSAEVATQYVKLLAIQRERAIVQAQWLTNRDALELLELRYRNAKASALDVTQQQQLVAQLEGLLPLLDMQAGLAESQLDILLGRIPDATSAIKKDAGKLPRVPKLPAIGLPSNLLENRPDIRSAWLRLQSAEWQVSAARADRLPSLRLTGRAVYQSNEIDTLFDDWLANLAAGLTGPLLDGKRRASEVERVRAVVAERLAAYRGVVLGALRDVEDALLREREQERLLVAARKELALSREGLQQAEQRYQNGLLDFLTVQNQRYLTQGLERSLLQKERDRLLYRIALYRALGGTWLRELPPEPVAPQTRIEKNSLDAEASLTA